MERQLAFRGNHTAKIDEKGRLKIPTEYRVLMEAHFGQSPSVYITCDDDEGGYARIYPMPHWEAYEAKLMTMPASSEARQKLLDNVSFFGQTSQIDPQGRVLMPPLLRESAGIGAEADVYVMGHTEFLTVWSKPRWEAYRANRQTTAEDRRERQQFGL
jgi:MraZ protein